MISEERFDSDHAQELIEMDKELDCKAFGFPPCGKLLELKAHSIDSKHMFQVTINRRGSLKLTKYTYQNRYSNNTILVRIDMDERRGHTNPDGTSVPTPHVHLFREGFDDKFAYPLYEVFPEFDTLKHDRVELFLLFVIIVILHVITL